MGLGGVPGAEPLVDVFYESAAAGVLVLSVIDGGGAQQAGGDPQVIQYEGH